MSELQKALFMVGCVLVPFCIILMVSRLRGSDSSLLGLLNSIRELGQNAHSWMERAEAAEAQLRLQQAPESGWDEDKIHAFRTRFWSARHSPWRRRTRSRVGMWGVKP